MIFVPKLQMRAPTFETLDCDFGKERRGKQNSAGTLQPPARAKATQMRNGWEKIMGTCWEENGKRAKLCQ